MKKWNVWSKRKPLILDSTQFVKRQWVVAARQTKSSNWMKNMKKSRITTGLAANYFYSKKLYDNTFDSLIYMPLPAEY